MRISANFVERTLKDWGQILLISWVFIISLTLIFNSFEGSPETLEFVTELLLLIIVFLLPVFGIIDFLFIHFKFKKIRSLFIRDGFLYLGKKKIDFNSIRNITHISYEQGRLTYRVLEFLFEDGTTIYTLCKPQFIWREIQEKPSSTYLILRSQFPALKRKFRAKRVI